MSRILLFVSCIALAACGSDSTAPSNTVTVTWSYNATNITGLGVSCALTGVTLNLSQSGSTFTGTTSGGTVSCTSSGQTTNQALTPASVLNGQLTGNSLQFDIMSSDIHHNGSLSGKSMVGTVALRVDVGVSLTGNFTATRQ